MRALSSRPILGIFGLSVVVLAVGAAAWAPAPVQDSVPYAVVLHRIDQDIHIQHTLGAPVSVGRWSWGTVSQHRAAIELPLEGANQQGTIQASLTADGEQWQIKKLWLRVDGATVNLSPERLTGPLGEVEQLLLSDRAAESLLVLNAQPPSADRERLLGQAQLRLGNLDMAEHALLRAASLDDGDARPRRLLGMVYYQLARHEDCVRAFTDALRIAPQDGQAWYSRAVCHQNLQQPDLARQSAENACALGAMAACQMQSRRSAIR
ncbi:MAG: cytochrome c oxidase assembly factor Coa1 family protein [Myxococcota bacterium]